MSYSAWLADTARKEFTIRAGLAAVSDFEREHGAFTPGELALIDGLGGGRRAWLTRCWCAKEAVAKAEGTGLAGRPRDFVITGITGETLTATAHGRTYRLTTCVLDNSHVVAWTTT